MMRRLCTSTSSPKEVSCGAVLLENSLLELTLLDRAWAQRTHTPPLKSRAGAGSLWVKGSATIGEQKPSLNEESSRLAAQAEPEESSGGQQTEHKEPKSAYKLTQQSKTEDSKGY